MFQPSCGLAAGGCLFQIIHILTKLEISKFIKLFTISVLFLFSGASFFLSFFHPFMLIFKVKDSKLTSAK